MTDLINRADEWCTDCKEYDHEKHCCPRFNRVIRKALGYVEAEHDKELQELRAEVAALKEQLRAEQPRANFWKVSSELGDMEIKQLRDENVAYRAKLRDIRVAVEGLDV